MDHRNFVQDEKVQLATENRCERCGNQLEGRVNRKRKRVTIFCRPCRRWSIIVEGKVVQDGTQIPEDVSL